MGIFSRHPKIPDPTVSYALQNNSTSDQPFHPGAPVIGTVNFSCPASRQIRSVSACFYGHVVTHNTRTENNGPNGQTRTIHYHDDVDLFRYIQDLTPAGGAFMVQENQDLNFDFNFAFPNISAYVRDDPYVHATAGSDAYDVGVQELPPSFTLGWDSHTKVADVEYRVEAAFIMDDNPEPFVVQFNPIPFSPYPPAMSPGFNPPFVEFIRKREKYSSSRLVGQEKSFRGSLRDKFSSRTPSLELTMKASLVPVMTVGKPFELFLCVEVGRMSDPQSIHIPSVVLRVKKLRLYKDTKFRALRVHRGSRPEHEATDEQRVELNCLPESRVVDQQPAPPPMYQPPQLSSDSKGTKKRPGSSSSSSSSSSSEDEVSPTAPQLIFPTSFEARIPSDIAPSFRTVNINHHFQLEVEVEVVIAEKDFEHQFAVGDVTVLPLPAGIPA